MADNKNQGQGKSLGKRIALVAVALVIVAIAHSVS